MTIAIQFLKYFTSVLCHCSVQRIYGMSMACIDHLQVNDGHNSISGRSMVVFTFCRGMMVSIQFLKYFASVLCHCSVQQIYGMSMVCIDCLQVNDGHNSISGRSMVVFTICG